MPLTRLQQILAGILSAETALVPIFVHNPQSQQIAAVIIAGESAVAGVIASLFGPKPKT